AEIWRRFYAKFHFRAPPPLGRNFKLRALNLFLNLGRASYKFKARAKFELASSRYFTPPHT
ncbi:hypothetical protein, partial [uncultured Campylobacter sp.]|uniref:hypothetical protein n=1 Tax=uncultured Campylobacter sp. TaxID=218934 RepID=UPI0026261365